MTLEVWSSRPARIIALLVVPTYCSPSFPQGRIPHTKDELLLARLRWQNRVTATRLDRYVTSGANRQLRLAFLYFLGLGVTLA